MVFGDSYSQVPRAGFDNWVTQLAEAGRIALGRKNALMTVRQVRERQEGFAAAPR